MKKLMILGILCAFALLSIGFASAITPNVAPYGNGIALGWGSYGSYPVNPAISGRYYPYAETPVRIGGFYGANSAFTIGLKPGFYDGPIWNGQLRTRITDSYYVRAGGNYGSTGYVGLRPGTFNYGTSTTRLNSNYMFHGPL